MTKRLRTTLRALGCALACSAVLPPAAGAVVVGIGDNSPEMFSDPKFLALNIHEARYVVQWNVATPGHSRQLRAASAWLNAAFGAGVTPLVSFGADTSRGSKIPSVGQYTGAMRAFMHKFPKVKRFTAWSEPDLIYTPLGQKPTLAAAYFNALVRSCRACTVLAGDMFMPAQDLRPYLRAYVKALHYRPAGWALHDYRDVRGRTTAQLRVMLSLTSGPIWLDETGGILRRGHWQYPNQSAAAAARDEQYLFSLPTRFRRINRIYHYQWREVRSAGWDSALMSARGSIRPAYYVVQRAAR
jgi:hypothetical protein